MICVVFEKVLFVLLNINFGLFLYINIVIN